MLSEAPSDLVQGATPELSAVPAVPAPAPQQRKVARQRPPRKKLKGEVVALERLEAAEQYKAAAARFLPPHEIGKPSGDGANGQEPADGEDSNSSARQALGFLEAKRFPEDAISIRGEQTRNEYVSQKKVPQIAALLGLLRQHHRERPFARIMDVGGGRGDYALALANAFPEASVDVVDGDEAALNTGRQFLDQGFAADDPIRDRISFTNHRFTRASLTDFQPPVTPDLVVALHACGALSDLSMSLAAKWGASFAICPCCFTKDPESYTVQEVLAPCEPREPAKVLKLCELNERRDLNWRAMSAVNALRVARVEKESLGVDGVAGYEELSIMKYTEEYSTRNMVLHGRHRQSGS